MTELELVEFIKEKQKEGLGDTRIGKLVGLTKNNIGNLRLKYGISGTSIVDVSGMKSKTWTVKHKSNRTNYYICECVCGNIKEFRKDNIIKSEIESCKICTHKELIDKSFEEFNRFCINAGHEPLVPEEVDIKLNHKLVCDNGHKFSTSLNKFEGCLKCKSTKDISNKDNISVDTTDFDNYKQELILAIKDIISKDYEVLIGEEFSMKIMVDGEELIVHPDIIVPELKLNISIHNSHNYRFNPKFHKSRSEFLKLRLIQEEISRRLDKNGCIQSVIITSGDINADISTFESKWNS